jgi:hypothetical protein
MLERIERPEAMMIAVHDDDDSNDDVDGDNNTGTDDDEEDMQLINHLYHIKSCIN